jgi:hypothetical protein
VLSGLSGKFDGVSLTSPAFAAVESGTRNPQCEVGQEVRKVGDQVKVVSQQGRCTIPEHGFSGKFVGVSLTKPCIAAVESGTRYPQY